MTESSESLILRQLVFDYRQIVFQFRLKLQVPVIVLSDLESIWGRWDPFRRTIELRRDLVFKYNWDTVLYVLKHEIAHQIVSEIFKLSDNGHQECFQRACDLLSLPPQFRKGSGDLRSSGDGPVRDSKDDKIINIVEKIKKLFSLSASNDKNEASLALSKAQELMRKYNIHESLVQETHEDFYYRIIDTQKNRLNVVYSHLSSLLIEHYNVDVLFTKTFNVKKLKITQSVEIYGRESHVLIAEYVFVFLLRTLEELWKVYQKDNGLKSIHLKKSFQLGIVDGFSTQLKKADLEVATSFIVNGTSQKLLIFEEEQKRKDFMTFRYPRLSHRKLSGPSINSEVFRRGHSAGKNLNLREAVNHSSSQVRFLTGKF